MTASILAFERMFSMPTFEGVKLLRFYVTKFPHLGIDEVIAVIQQVELDVRSFDLEASRILCDLIPGDLAEDGVHFYRGCIREVLLALQPMWARTMLYGRHKLFATLHRDEQSIFRQAGLWDDPPDDELVEWWDALTNQLRTVVDERLGRGRRAEKLTIEHELERLAREGVSERPRWVGFDDNTKGYDVLSYERVDETITNKLIEVKSTIASPLRFRVTRNEWEQAVRSGPAYVFHIWDLQRTPPILHVRTVDQVRPHIPTDNEKGKWKDVEVPVGPGI